MTEITFDFACTDDCLNKMVPSDLRQLVSERDTLRQQVKEYGAENIQLKLTALKQAPCDIPEGYVLVPVEATYEMREAVRLAIESEGLTTTAWQRNTICAAMLSAAPKPKGETK